MFAGFRPGFTQARDRKETGLDCPLDKKGELHRVGLAVALHLQLQIGNSCRVGNWH